MDETTEKGPQPLTATLAGLEHLQQVQELNLAFLGLLQGRLGEPRPCFGLPAVARPALKHAQPEMLEIAACFPRALFYLYVAATPARERPDAAIHLDDAEHDLVLSMLFTVRHASRQSPYQARLLFGLEEPDLDVFRRFPLTDLQRLAATPGVLQCACRDRHWLWQGLFTATRPELRRQLTLMALQPGVDADWPRRRPPHASV
jgi:hypothetical protein